MNPLKHIMSAEEASKLWGLSPGYIKNLCARKLIDCKKVGKTWVIDKTQPNPKKLKEELSMRTFNELVKYFGDIELDETTHVTSKDDFDNVESFYLENVNQDSYEQLLKEQLTDEEKTTYDVVKLWNAVKEYIQDHVKG